MPGNLARIGVTIFFLLFAIALGTEREAAGRALGAAASLADVVTIPAAFVTDGPVAIAGFQAAPPAGDAAVTVETAVATPRPAAALSPGGVMLASWYGPGFYGNRTACGQVYTPELLGVAHLNLPCGTLLTLTYGGRTVTVPVIDRGPYIAGRAIDLSNATKLALGCSDLCTLRMQVSP